MPSTGEINTEAQEPRAVTGICNQVDCEICHSLRCPESFNYVYLCSASVLSLDASCSRLAVRHFGRIERTFSSFHCLLTPNAFWTTELCPIPTRGRPNRIDSRELTLWTDLKVELAHQGCWCSELCVSRRPNRFFNITLCREYLTKLGSCSFDSCCIVTCHRD